MSDERIATLLCTEIASVQNPNDPSDTYALPHIGELVDAFVRFLHLDCKEPAIQEVGTQVVEALGAFAAPALDPTKLSAALNDLSTGFEGFLKKIAAVRYEGDQTRLHGDGVSYAGLLHTTLGNLLEGRVAKINPRDASIPPLSAPLVTFAYGESNLRDTIYNRVRLLRNDIHTARARGLFDLIRLFRIASAAYLFAVEENVVLIRKRVDPLFVYLTGIQRSFEKWEYRYVELEGEERSGALLLDWPALHAFEWHDEDDDDVTGPIPWDDETAAVPVPPNPEPPTRTPVLHLAEDNSRFWLVGEPGAGKSTTLQMLAWRRATELLDLGYLVKPCPIYIRASRLESSVPFITLIAEELGTTPQFVADGLRAGRLWLLIDGMNEIAPADRESAYRQIGSLLERYANAPVILTSRKHGFSRPFPLPVFEILPLTNDMILDYLRKNSRCGEDGQRLYNRLAGRESLLLELARNPLMLRMLARVARNGELPANRGQLFRLFLNWIFSRELHATAPAPLLKEKVLSRVAFELRAGGRTQASRDAVLQWIGEAEAEWHADASVTDVFDELLRNHVLEMDAEARVSFFHELVQDYFAALELQRRYVRNPQSIRSWSTQPMWAEVLVMLSGLLDEADDLVMSISQDSVALAAKCVACGARVTAHSISALMGQAGEMLSAPDTERVDAGTALLELATDDALRLIVRHLARDASYPLPRALERCQRPHVAAVKLLTYGLTGRERIFQCLKMLAGEFASRTVVDSEAVARAELTLLDGAIDDRELSLICRVGISGAAKKEIEDRITGIISTAEIGTSIWRTAISCTIGHHIEGAISIAMDRAREADVSDGQTHYSVFFACAALKEMPEAQQLALHDAKRCWRLGLHGLFIKYVTFFAFGNIVDQPPPHAVLTSLASAGRIQMLVAYSSIFTTEDFTPLLALAVEQALANNKLANIYRHHAVLADVLADKQEMLRDLALGLASSGLRLKTLRGYIIEFGLEEYFTDYGFIKLYVARRGYGFITNILTREDTFFHISTVTNREDIGDPVPRDIVRYLAEESRSHPGKTSAKWVTVIRPE